MCYSGALRRGDVSASACAVTARTTQGIPQPVVVLIEALLEKDPAQRFQTPKELLKAIPTIAGAIDAGVESLVRASRRRPLPIRVSELASLQQDLHQRRFR